MEIYTIPELGIISLDAGDPMGSNETGMDVLA